MNNALQDFRLIWNCAMAHRCNGVFKILTWGLAALIVIVPIGDWLFHRDLHEAIGSISAPLTLLYVCLWMTMIGGVIRQNTPANAQLVPRLRKRSIQMTLIIVFLATAVTSLFLSYVFDRYGWCFLFLGFYVIGVAFGQGRSIGWLSNFMFWVYPAIARRQSTEVSTLMWSDTALLIGALVLVALIYYFIRITFPAGGDRSWNVQSRVQKQNQTNKEPMAINANSSSFALLPYDTSFRRDCAKHSANLILYVLGPSAHWTASLRPMALVSAAVVIVKAYLLISPHPDVSGFLAADGWAFGLMLLMFSIPYSASRIAVTTTEQSLFRLTPHAPSSQLFNRRLGAGLLRTYAQGWLLLTATMVIVSVLTGASTEKYVIELSICSVLLLFACLQLRDYSKEVMLNKGYGRHWQLLAFLLLLPTFMMAVTHVSVPLSIWITITALSIVVSSVLIARRWRSMMAAPIAFPAGRMLI